jgi:flagellar protein FliO/FliZ
MTPTLFIVALFVVAIALIPFGVKKLKQKMASVVLGAMDASRIVSAVAVGVNQRVVTLEVGPSHARVWLILGITPTAINCLHKSPLLSESESRESGGFDKSGTDMLNDSLV